MANLGLWNPEFNSGNAESSPGIQNSKGGTVLEDITWNKPCQVCSFAWFDDSMSKPQINNYCRKALYL